jgi:hypothetical protein
LGSLPIAFRTIIRLNLKERNAITFLFRHIVPPVKKTVHDKVTCLSGTAESNVQLTAVFIHDTEWSILFRTSHVVIGCLVIPPSFSSTAIFAYFNGGFAVHAYTLDNYFINLFSIFFFDIFEDGICLRNFF